ELNAVPAPTDVSNQTLSAPESPVVSAASATSPSTTEAAPIATFARPPEVHRPSVIEQPAPHPSIGDVAPSAPARPVMSAPVQRVADPDEPSHTHQVRVEA